MKELILRDWNFMRVFRLVMGMIILVQGILTGEVFIIVAGILFTGMAVFNTGCCGVGGCSTPAVRKTEHLENKKEISYEEVV